MSPGPADPSGTYVDAPLLASRKAALEREYSLDDLPRLSEAGAAPGSQAAVRLQFYPHDGRTAIDGELSGVAVLTCQRCLAPVRQQIEDSFQLVLVDSEEAIAAVSEPYDAVVADPARLDVRWLAEEQMLLALPLVPKHESEQECQQQLNVASIDKRAARRRPVEPVASTREDDRQRPFENLRDLLRKS